MVLCEDEGNGEPKRAYADDEAEAGYSRSIVLHDRANGGQVVWLTLIRLGYYAEYR